MCHRVLGAYAGGDGGAEAAASPDSPQAACLGEVENSDVMVLLMGARYGDVQQSGRSATHEEWVHARSIRKKVLVFVEKVKYREPEQQAFVERVRGGRMAISGRGSPHRWSSLRKSWLH